MNSYSDNFLASCLRAGSLDRPDAVFVHGTAAQDQLTYNDLFAGAEAMALALVNSGLMPGDRVAVQVNKSIEAVQLYLATTMAGGVFLPLNTAYTAPELEYFLGDAQPHLLVCDPSSEQELKSVAGRTGVPLVWTLSADNSGSLIDASQSATGTFSCVARQGDDLAAILYTSGTTGRSKGAMLTHDALSSNAQTLAQYWEFSDRDVLIHALPLFHTHGLFVATNITLVAGSSMIFMKQFDAELIVDSFADASVLMGVPTFYVRLLKQPGLADAARNMRLFVSGSAPLLAETHIQWQTLTGHAILERYGMTETNMNTSNPYQGERIAGTVGFPLPGVEIKIADPETGDAVQQGDIGMIEVRGPNVFKGYWRMPEKTAEELRSDGFFITGDLGRIDEKGYIHIVGRDKDLIISGGYNIYPKEIELLIDDVPGVNESAVIGVPHPDFGEGVVAVVVAESGASLGEAQVMDGVGGNLARFKQPKVVVFVDSLPRNTMGKVQKNVLRETYKDVLSL